MGQYNFLSSCFSDNMTTKMINLFVANELWRNFQHTRFADVSPAIKKTIFEDKYWDEILSLRGEYQQKNGFVPESPIFDAI